MKIQINRALLGVAGIVLAAAPAWAVDSGQSSKAAPQQSSAEYNSDQRNRDNQTSMNRYSDGRPESPRGTDSTAPIVSK